MENSEKEENDATEEGESPQKALRKAAKERRKKLAELVKKVGLKNARGMVNTLAKQFNVVERTIYTDFEYIKKKWKPEEIKEIKINLQIARDNALNKAMEMLATATTKSETATAIDLVVKTSKHYREELEEWGEKPKEAEIHKFEGVSATFNLVEKSVEEIKGEKSDNKPQADGDSQSPGR